MYSQAISTPIVEVPCYYNHIIKVFIPMEFLLCDQSVHSQVLNVSNQMGNRRGKTRTIGVDRLGNQICHILIKIQSLSQKNKKDTPRIIQPL